MRKKLAFTLFSVGSLLAAGVFTFACVFTSKNANLFEMKATDSTYSVTLNSQKAPSELTSEYQDNVTTTIQTANGNNLNLNIVLGKTASNKYVQLASRGIIYNFGSESGRMNGINGITATFSGSLLVKTSSKQLSNNGIFLDDGFTLLTSGTKFTPSSSAKYFAIVANDGGATIDSIKLDYTCSASDIDVSALNGKYTGTGNDSYIWELDLNNGAATIKTLNAPTVKEYSGTYQFLNSTQAKCTFSSNTDYTFNVGDDGKLTFVSKSGTNASQIAQVDFYKVFNVEDFENYTTAGNGYDQNHSKYSTTGARAHWYADYSAGGSNTSPIGGTGWGLMGSADYMQFTTTKGRNGSKAAAFKGNNNSLRFIQMNALYGVSQVIGKGATLSFWAKGAYSDNAFSTASTSDATIKVMAFYNSQVTSSNQGTRTEKEFTISAGSDWKEYTMTLDSSKNYYAIGFLCKQSATTYTPIDDITIYTASPYATRPYPEGTFLGSATVLGNQFTIALAIGDLNNGIVAVMLSNTDAVATGITYNFDTQQVSITTTGSYSSYKYGTITGTYDAANDRITGISCSGSIKSYVSNNGSITATKPSTYFNCDGTTAELQAQFKRRYRGSDWTVDTTNADKITSNATHYVAGKGALRLRPYGSGDAYALNLQNDFSTAKSVENLAFWVYNSSDTDINLREWIYKGKSFGSNAEIGALTAKANGWTYCAMGFTKASIYNFQISVWKSNNSSTTMAVALIFDNIILF